jgi:hypothetical protein
MTDKVTVHFDMDKPYSITTEGRALVCPLDHPSDAVSNNGMVMTTPVVRIHLEPSQIFFETDNSYYRGIHVHKREEV